MLNLNLSGLVNVFRLLAKPSLCLPHSTASTFNDLPVPLNTAFEGKKVEIKAVVLDKDDCFAYPETNQIHPPYLERFRQLQKEFPGHKLLIVSNTAGATSYDRDHNLAAELEGATDVSVLLHKVKKPGCKDEIMAHFKKHPETQVTHPSQIAIIGDRLMTDMMLANMMGSWGIWIKQGVAPLKEKSIFARFDLRLGSFLLARGYKPSDPQSPFE
ncbi:mitochondrial PGP phosphatase [Pseudomassariella vexata]|uniref:Mitochondrial PGP phosphatase n=1 Tax=Pseudomassariella vexata TaxID=1141098 RepID=A0A1Y2EIC0_9PEZI|nr:mitochondrial PGP phosphatase [Pseudomassariella vexata]ORY71313.1 mitochondrial PGP phosphatase [Pseudomassariella vexata]